MRRDLGGVCICSAQTRGRTGERCRRAGIDEPDPRRADPGTNGPASSAQVSPRSAPLDCACRGPGSTVTAQGRAACLLVRLVGDSTRSRSSSRSRSERQAQAFAAIRHRRVEREFEPKVRKAADVLLVVNLYGSRAAWGMLIPRTATATRSRNPALISCAIYSVREPLSA